MGNFYQVEIEFVRRTLNLVNQYEQLKELYDFEEQYNHTLLINCLLGLIILPKEKSLSFIPKQRMEFVRSLQQWGIEKSTFNPGIRTSVELFERLRNAVAHFDIRFISDTPEHLIDRIEFRDEEADMVVATFHAGEFLDFIRFYATTLLDNLERNI